METRRRKRAEASSAASAPPPSSSASTASRSSKRARTTSAVTTRSRAAAAAMDGRRTSGKGSDKGKEKEADSSRARDRAKEIERSLGLNADPGGDEGDSDEREGVAALSTSSALQGLLRKLGAGFDDFLPGSALAGTSSQPSGKLKRILTGLRADGEEGKQMEALSQLCDMLSIGTEDSLASFAVDSFVPVLVGLLNHESNPDIMLLAARALTHLCDVLPSSCASVVHYGGVSCFCSRLLTIEYMDLAEQSLQALNKISQEHPTACLRAGALMAVLSYLDFFSTGVQRVALSTAANICKRLPPDAADFVMEAVPLLTNLLRYHDSKVLEYASVCLIRMAEAFASSSDKLDELCNYGLVAQAAGLISTSNSGGGQISLSTSTYTGLIRLLSTCARGSALGAKPLHLLGISGILKDILLGAGLVATSVTVSPSLTRPPEQVFEIVNLANELLPPLPQGTISLPTCSNGFIKGSSIKSTIVASRQPENANSSYDSSTREKLLQDQPELLRQFGMNLLPILIQIHGSSVNGPIRHKCLSVIAKLMYFSTADMIQSLLGITNISSFLAGILAWRDPEILIPALQIAEILMEKLPGIFCKMFVREGVVHAVDALSLSDFSDATSVPSLPIVKDNDSTNGTSRSRRNRRRGVSSSMDGNSVEDSVHGAVTIGPPPDSSNPLTRNSGLRSSVSAFAKAFKEKYFSSESGGAEVGLSEDLVHLKNLSAKLNASNEVAKSKTKGKSKASGVFSFDTTDEAEEQLNGLVSEIMSELSKEDSVSTFEFIGSGVVSALLNYLSCGLFSKERISETDLQKLREQATKRFKSFVATGLLVNVKQGHETPMTVLVRKLQNALTSLERFPVVLSRSSGGSSRLSSGLSALTQPVKLRLSRVQDDKSLRDYSSNVVLIDPLASLAAVEEFLWPRIQRVDHEHKPSGSTRSSEKEVTAIPSCSIPASVLPSSGHRPSTRSRSSVTIESVGRKESNQPDTNSAKRKGKAVLKAIPDEKKGPQTRNATRRRATLDKDVQTRPEHGNSLSEEDLEFSATDVDDALMIREDNDMSEDEEEDQELLREDSLPACLPEKVHDVNLGDMTDDDMVASTINHQTQPSSGPSGAAASKSTEAGGGSFSSRGAMSFAAAAMSGLSSLSGRGIGGRDCRGLPLGHSSKGPPKLTFSSGGKLLNRRLTIYQAIQQQLMVEEDHDERQTNTSFLPSDGSHLWSDIYTINYQKADNELDQCLIEGSTSSPPPRTEGLVSPPVLSSDRQWQHMPLLDSVLQGELPSDLEKNDDTRNVLLLLRVLLHLNQASPRLRFQATCDDFAEGKMNNYESPSTFGIRVPLEEFINNKLTPKLARQIQDALALCSGSLPTWCYQLTKACPFLFNFETRRQYFYSTAFGLSRALHRLQQQVAESHGSTNDREFRIGRLRRQKVRVSRKRILESAAKVMEMYSSQKAVLEVEYFGEVGTGLGPTLEFYTLVSHELQKEDLQMWRSSAMPQKSEAQIDGSEDMDISGNMSRSKKLRQCDNDLIHAPFGLFPRPWPPNAECTDGTKFSKVVEHFRLAGRMIAKALQDGRLLDLPLSIPFYKLVLGQELDLHDILSFDAEFGSILLEMQALLSRKLYLEKTHGKDHKGIAGLHFRGTPVEDLCLDFTLPGYPDYVLKTGEESTMVDIYNLEEYITLVVDATIRNGIARQMEAFRAGFNQVFDITSLQIFSPDELDYLLCGRRELWEAETLVDYIKFDHGYTAKSPAIINLLKIMGEFTHDQQRAFCRFVTGTPSLPLGGLAALNPKLTIVRKHPSSSSNMALNLSGVSDSADDDLPSVMTCANYLKLPAYSTREIMHKKLLYAISEGQGSFDLS